VGRPAAFFDLDKTIIAKSSTLAFSKPFQAGGLISRRAVLRSAYAQFVYLVGGADHDQMEKMREFLSRLCAGWDVQTVRDIVADTLHNVVDPLVFDEAVSLIEEHHLAGRDVIIVSASGAEVVEPIGEMLGADGVVATQMRVVDGRYTGEIDYYAYAENKAAAMRRLAEEHEYDLSRSYAYSDSITDVHMLEAVGNPYAVNPDRELRRQANARGWPVLVFTKPVTAAEQAHAGRPGARHGRRGRRRGVRHGPAPDRARRRLTASRRTTGVETKNVRRHAGAYACEPLDHRPASP
jgi:HAD superfamily hydrolase (TIGR01490 family)